MRILFITQEDTLAGSSYSVYYLAVGLAERGHQVFLAARPGSFLSELAVKSPLITFFPIHIRSRLDLDALRLLRDYITENRIEIVNAQSSNDRYLTIFLRFFYRLNFRLYHTRRQYPLSAGGVLQNWFYVAGTDKVIVISQELKRIFQRKGYPSRHLEVIQNGIPGERLNQWNTDAVAELRLKHRLGSDDIVVGCVSRPKKQDQIFEALKILNDPKIKLLLVGVPESYFDQTFKRLNLTNEVIYAGLVGPSVVLNYYKLFTLSVLASTSEGFGLALVEAMAMGCPVVATDFGGIRDIVSDGLDGLLFDDGDIASLAECMAGVIHNTKLKSSLIAEGLKTARRFDMSYTISRYEAFFGQLEGQVHQHQFSTT